MEEVGKEGVEVGGWWRVWGVGGRRGVDLRARICLIGDPPGIDIVAVYRTLTGFTGALETGALETGALESRSGDWWRVWSLRHCRPGPSRECLCVFLIIYP